MDYVCEDIVTAILTRLPVKSLVRSMAVCRFWKSIITSPQFRLEFSKRPAKLLVHTDQECYFALVEDDENLVRFETIDFPLKHLLHNARLIGSVNGLVCLCIYTPNQDNIMIWNPSITKHAVIPMNPLGEIGFLYADGFGATISHTDYKYVGIVRFRGKLAVDIYSWKIGTWRRIDLDMDLYRCKEIRPGCASLRGRLHWMAIDRGSRLQINSIHSFQLEDEVYEETMLPECVSSSRYFAYRNVYVIKELLAVIVDEEERPYRIMHSSVWVMQEYGDVNSWTKLCRVDLTTMIDVDWALHDEGHGILRIQSAMVRLLKNGELLLGLEVWAGYEKIHPPKLVKYNPMTRKGTDVIRGVSSSSSSSKLCGFIDSYKESLDFLTDGHRVLGDHEVFSRGRVVLETRANTNITG